ADLLEVLEAAAAARGAGVVLGEGGTVAVGALGGMTDVGVLVDPEFAQPGARGGRVVHLHGLGDVRSGAEVVADAPDHQVLEVVVGVGAVQQGGVAQPGGGGGRVEVVGPVEGDGGDPRRGVLLVADDLLRGGPRAVTHVRESFGYGRSSGTGGLC